MDNENVYRGLTANDAQNAFEGPTFNHIIQDGEWRVFVCWGLTWAAGFATLLVWLKYSTTMKNLDDRHDPLRSWYMRIVFMGEIWAITSGLSVAFVRGVFLFQILQKAYEALTLCCLRDAVIELAGRKEQLLLSLEGKKDKYWSVFPLFFTKRCFKETAFTREHIKWSYRLTRQGYLVIPGLACVQLFALIMGDSGFPHRFVTVLAVGQLISIIVSVYGVLLVLAPVREIEAMRKHRLGHKFMIIKGMVILGVIQGLIVMILVDVGLLARDPVLSSNTYTAAVLWASMLLALESPFYVYFAAKYYPLCEVVEYYEDVDATIAQVLEGNLSNHPEALKLVRTASSFARDRLALSAGVGLGANGMALPGSALGLHLTADGRVAGPLPPTITSSSSAESAAGVPV